MPHISERQTDLPDATIGKLLKLAAEDKTVLNLGPGEPDFEAPKPVVEWTKKFADNCNHYSPTGGRTELKEALVKKLKKDNGIKTNPDNIIVTCGSQEALLLATACSMDVSEQVIMPSPSFLGYLPTFELFNAFPVPVQLKANNNWDIDPGELKHYIDKKTRAILINTPSNPTGNVLSKKLLEEFKHSTPENASKRIMVSGIYDNITKTVDLDFSYILGEGFTNNLSDLESGNFSIELLNESNQLVVNIDFNLSFAILSDESNVTATNDSAFVFVLPFIDGVDTIVFKENNGTKAEINKTPTSCIEVTTVIPAINTIK